MTASSCPTAAIFAPSNDEDGREPVIAGEQFPLVPQLKARSRSTPFRLAPLRGRPNFLSPSAVMTPPYQARVAAALTLAVTNLAAV